MDHDSPRWVEVTPSQFSHEAAGLTIVRELLPEAAPFRAWSNFEFRDIHGKWHEVDLLVVGRRRLHLVELKYYSGELRGNDLVWLRKDHRPADSPLKLAHRKAQRFKTRLRAELGTWAREENVDLGEDRRTAIPYVQASVFLHHPELRCHLPRTSRIDLFTLDEAAGEVGLPGISERLLEASQPDEVVRAGRSDIIAALLARIGLVRRRRREVGSWVIDEQPLGEGEYWQDWPAFHRFATAERARVRFYALPPGAAHDEQERLRRLAAREYRVTSRLSHDGLLTPRDLVENELGTGLVYPHDERYQRLDLWLAGQPEGMPMAMQLALLRQVAETVEYAHRHRVAHRGLTPAALWVRTTSGDDLRVLLGDWQVAGRAGQTQVGSGPPTGFTDMSGARRAHGVDGDTDVYRAPEGVWNRSANPIRLDVFSLGAIAYRLVTGRAPASDPAALRERLQRDGGLDLAADLPQVSPALRTLVLRSTRPVGAERVPDMPTFLSLLANAERELAAPEQLLSADPLEAAPGTVIAGRFRLEQRLGAGSTAVALLVTDLAAEASGGSGERRVLKVAKDDAAGQRLVDEADVLRRVSHPRVVRLVEGPLSFAGRRALLVAFAGEQTLAEVLCERARLSLDLLERWGTELLDAVVALDRAGVDHRDIKPANLGVLEGRGDRAKHLTLFDFSLARAGTAAVTAGTPPYLDPFLEKRGRYDSAAERYSAAVVLFEMATGQIPVYGDDRDVHPDAVTDEVQVVPEMFDPAVAPRLVAFFRCALARDAAARHGTAADMLAEWRAAFVPVSSTDVGDADRRAAAATLDTPLAESGLSARALSALEPLDLVTVADLLAVDPVRLSRWPGVADATRRQISGRAKQWRAALGTRPGRRPPPDADLPDPLTAATLLIRHAGSARARARRRAAGLLLGLDDGLDAFATHAELAHVLGASVARGGQHVTALQRAWADHEESARLLDTVARLTRSAVVRLGGAAAVEEVTGEILGQLPPCDRRDADRLAAGLLRLALDRVDELARAEGLDPEEGPLIRRRRGGKVVLLARTAALLDAVDAAVRAAERLVADARAASEPVVPRQRAADALLAVASRVADEPAFDGDRLLRLAGLLSPVVAVSGRGELYGREMGAADAVLLTLSGLSGQQPMSPSEVQERVRARFPVLPPVPGRPRLDELIAEAGLPLEFDEATRTYRAAPRGPLTTLKTKSPTLPAPPVELDVSGGYVARRLAESINARSFLALGAEADRLDRAVALLRDRYGAEIVDVTQVLVEALRRRAEAAGVPWDVVRAADAAGPGTRDAMGLAALVEQTLPDVEAAVVAACGAPEGTRPVVLVDLAPVARYGHLTRLSRWTDLTAPRRQPIWAVIPQLVGNHGPLVDGRPLPLAAPGQFLRLDDDWLRGAAEVPSGSDAVEGAST